MERKQELSNRIVRRRDIAFQEVPHRKKNKNKKHKNKFNVKFQIRGKYLNETLNGIKNIRLPNEYNVTFRYNKMKYICPLGYIRRKNRCGK